MDWILFLIGLGLVSTGSFIAGMFTYKIAHRKGFDKGLKIGRDEGFEKGFNACFESIEDGKQVVETLKKNYDDKYYGILSEEVLNG